MATAISFANVSKHFGDLTAVHDLTFSVSEGEVVGFVGPNGAGKTTTISMLLGFISVSNGTISLRTPEQTITTSTASKYHSDMGYVAGDMVMFDNLTGKQYIDFLFKQNRGDTALQAELIARLKPVLHKRIKNLSRGNRQKVALIGALQHDPKLLILDEPTSGLDPLMQDVFLSLISEQAKRGATVFMSSHILSEVASACSRVIFMKNGRVIVDKLVSSIEEESGKQVMLKAQPHVIKTAKKQLLPDSFILNTTENTLTFVYKSDTSLLLRWLSTRPVEDVSIVDRSLDDIFKDMYVDNKESNV